MKAVYMALLSFGFVFVVGCGIMNNGDYLDADIDLTEFEGGVFDLKINVSGPKGLVLVTCQWLTKSDDVITNDVVATLDQDGEYTVNFRQKPISSGLVQCTITHSSGESVTEEQGFVVSPPKFTVEEMVDFLYNNPWAWERVKEKMGVDDSWTADEFLQELLENPELLNQLQAMLGHPPTPPTMPVNCACGLSQDLFYGSIRGDVYCVQDLLKSLGYIDIDGEDKSGLFEGWTQEAVQRFQQDWGIPETGYVGPLTRARLKELVCGGGAKG